MVWMRPRRLMFTTGQWMEKETSTGDLCSHLSTYHQNKSWLCRRRYNVLCIGSEVLIIYTIGTFLEPG